MDNFDNVLVVDADGHVYEGNVDLTNRMPEKWRSQAPVRLKTTKATREFSWRGASGPHPKALAPASPVR